MWYKLSTINVRFYCGFTKYENAYTVKSLAIALGNRSPGYTIYFLYIPINLLKYGEVISENRAEMEKVAEEHKLKITLYKYKFSHKKLASPLATYFNEQLVQQNSENE